MGCRVVAGAPRLSRSAATRLRIRQTGGWNAQLPGCSPDPGTIAPNHIGCCQNSDVAVLGGPVVGYQMQRVHVRRVVWQLRAAEEEAIVTDRATREGAARPARRIDPRQLRHQQAVVCGEIRRLARATPTRRPPSADAGLLAGAGLLPAVIADLESTRRPGVSFASSNCSSSFGEPG
jgi:phage tail tape-measure protein